MSLPAQMAEPTCSVYLENAGRLGTKKYFQYIEISTGVTGKPEMVRVSGKIGGSKREVRKRFGNITSATSEYESLLSHLKACGYTEGDKSFAHA